MPEQKRCSLIALSMESTDSIDGAATIVMDCYDIEASSR
jgi:hypothetical protein